MASPQEDYKKRIRMPAKPAPAALTYPHSLPNPADTYAQRIGVRKPAATQPTLARSPADDYNKRINLSGAMPAPQAQSRAANTSAMLGLMGTPPAQQPGFMAGPPPAQKPGFMTGGLVAAPTPKTTTVSRVGNQVNFKNPDGSSGSIASANADGMNRVEAGLRKAGPMRVGGTTSFAGDNMTNPGVMVVPAYQGVTPTQRDLYDRVHQRYQEQVDDAERFRGQGAGNAGPPSFDPRSANHINPNSMTFGQLLGNKLAMRQDRQNLEWARLNAQQAMADRQNQTHLQGLGMQHQGENERLMMEQAYGQPLQSAQVANLNATAGYHNALGKAYSTPGILGGRLSNAVATPGKTPIKFESQPIGIDPDGNEMRGFTLPGHEGLFGYDATSQTFVPLAVYDPVTRGSTGPGAAPTDDDAKAFLKSNNHPTPEDPATIAAVKARMIERWNSLQPKP